MSARASLTVSRVPLAEVVHLRERYREEMGAQIVHDSWHARGFTDLYMCRDHGEVAGYGAVGGAPGDPRHTFKELYLGHEWRHRALEAFDALVAASGASRIEAQTNDRLLLSLLLDRAGDWMVTHVLFAGGAGLSALPRPEGVVLRSLTEVDRARVFPHTHEPVGEWVLEREGTVVATGGVMFHYNPPYGDLYMEVAPSSRCRGYGSYLVQELARICREQGKTPAARCRPDNIASRRTLARAGLWPCAHILRGTLRS